MRLVLKESKEKVAKFKLPSFEEEKEPEFSRYDFSEKELKKIENQFEEKNLKPLSDGIWKQLNNTDSWETTDIEDVMRQADEYGRDANSIIDALKNNIPLPAPIILHKDGKYELIAGNTRLMASRALKIRPTVLMIKL